MSTRRRRPKVCCIEPLEQRALFAFGVTVTSTSYIVDTGADVKFSILRGGSLSSTIHLGDMTSVTYKGQEMLATYAQSSRYSHYEQGLGSASIISYTIGGNNSWILVTCDDSAAASGGVIQYYAVRKGDNTIYMASLPTDVTNGPGEGRYIAYLSRSVFANPEDPSDNSGTTGAIEGSDVFGHADGTTTSKFYNMGRQMIDNVYHGVVGVAGGNSVGAWMFMGNREHSAGGPFFKDIDFQSSTSQVEIYNCVFTGHTQTEPYRQGLQGPYALQFNSGSAPIEPDYSWMETMLDGSGQPLIHGLIPASQRGTLSGTASGVPAGHDVVVGLSNATAQYWTRPDATGAYTIAGIQPGTYTETLYDNELEVGTRAVTITAGVATRADIADTYYTPSAANTIWRIGTWDGTPAGFLNADRIETMHPSDVRMSSWTSTPTFTIGANTDAQWPMVQFMGVNNSQRITFNLTAAQVASALTLRIGITLGFEGGRNRVTVNAGKSYAWTSSIPSASRDLNSRGITRGTYRGPNQLYTYNIPTSALRAGTNTIDLPVVSGSYQNGQTWLSPNVVYDAIDLVTTSSLANAPRVTTITIAPANSTVAPNGQKQFTAAVKDQFGNAIPANLVWTTTAGTIDDTGLFTGPPSGSATVKATLGSISGSTSVSVPAATTINGDLSAAGQPDAIRVTRNGAWLDVYLNNPTNTPSYRYDFASLSSLTIDGVGGDDVITLDYTGGGSLMPPGGVFINGGTGANRWIIIGPAATGDSVTVLGGAVSLSGGNETSGLALTVASGATVSLETSARLYSLSLTGGRFNLNGNQLLVDYAPGTISPITTIRADLQSGRNGGTWTGNGIFSTGPLATSNLGIGYTEAAAIALTNFAGQPVDASAVLVREASYGDAQLDGAVNFDDFALSDRGRAKGLGLWLDGDFDYDGLVTDADAIAINTTFAMGPIAVPTVASEPAPVVTSLAVPTAQPVAAKRKVKHAKHHRPQRFLVRPLLFRLRNPFIR